jgi:hypothetical protein
MSQDELNDHEYDQIDVIKEEKTLGDMKQGN